MHTLDRFTRSQTTPAPAAPQPEGAFDEPVFLPLDDHRRTDGWSPPHPHVTPHAPLPPRAPHPRHAAEVPPARDTPRSTTRVIVAAVCAAALAGAGAGYVAGWVQADGSAQATSDAASPLTLSSGAIDVPAVAAAVEPSVVTITAEVAVRQGPRSTTASSAGTGIVLTADGEILTNAHVVAGASSISVTFAGESAGHTASLVGIDEANDIAVLKVQGVSGLTPAVIGDSDQLVVGEDVVAVGNALDLEGEMSVTSGIVSALDRTVQVDGTEITGMMQTDTAISSGNSGGPLVNAAGEVIGVVTAGANSSRTVTAENIGFAITINTAMEIVAGLRV